MDAIKNTVEVSGALKKESTLVSSFSGFVFGHKHSKKDELKSMSRIQKHAEIIYAEAYLLKAILFILTDPNMMGLVREGLAIRQSFSTYKSCYKYLVSVMAECKKNNVCKYLF
jgi:hypothetical protein